MTSVDPEDLAKRARAKDHEAFEALVGPLRDRLRRQVRARMGHRVRAEVEPDDIVQETLVTAWTTIERLEWRGEESFCRWLATIAEHLLWRASRGAGRSRLELPADSPASDPSAGSLVERGDRLERLEQALADLSPDHREVIVLTRLEKLRIREAAERLGRSDNATRKLLGRALRELRDRYGDTTGSLRLPDRPLEIGGAPDDA